MFEEKKQKQMLVILIVVVVATLVIYFWSKGGFSLSSTTPGQEQLTVEPAPGLSPEIIKEEVMQILQDDSFLELEPQGEVPSIEEAQRGRPNPFQAL